MKENNNKENIFRILILTPILAAVFFITYYFHAILRIHTIYTHIFYIPIILSVLWWKKKGLIVVFLIITVLMFVHIYTTPFLNIYDDIIRSVMFLVISIIIIFLSEKIDKNKEILIEREKNFRELAENVTSGILIKQSDGTIVYANKKISDILDYKIEKIINSDFNNLPFSSEFESAMKHDKDMEDINNDKKVKNEFEIEFNRKDNKRIFLEITASEIKWHGKTADIIILRDITKRKEVEDIIDEEKKRLAMDLHDELGSLVVALDSNLVIAEEEIKNRNWENAINCIHDIRSAIQNGVRNLKRIAKNLMPLNLDHISLPNALKKYFKNVTKNKDFNIIFNTNMRGKKLDIDVSVALFRIIQEALNNILQHTNAKSAIIKLTKENNELKLNIQDDGQGFDSNKILQQGDKSIKIGLQGMKERVESLDGTFNIKSEFKKGTLIEITLPAL
ncbi:MAG: PAS domain S-box protein [bacterium]